MAQCASVAQNRTDIVALRNMGWDLGHTAWTGSWCWWEISGAGGRKGHYIMGGSYGWGTPLEMWHQNSMGGMSYKVVSAGLKPVIGLKATARLKVTPKI